MTSLTTYVSDFLTDLTGGLLFTPDQVPMLGKLTNMGIGDGTVFFSLPKNSEGGF